MVGGLCHRGGDVHRERGGVAVVMTIEEYADIINVRIVISRAPNHDGWIARFEESEIVEGRLLKSVFGCGQSPSAALAHYAKQIKGERLAVTIDGQRVRLVVPEIA